MESKIRAADFGGAETKNELLRLLGDLKSEIAALEQNCEKHKLLKHSVEELRASVAGFEQSHPKLIQAVNNISNTLSNFGV